ncbi:endonuclease/exonuclease/phosphatase family protein [Nocardioides sp.]|uniref:endonuclease/exonuclease/phosphatase family protein n=1 Tax=Nocardioides sp. TaxID=35761 RepID=UPI003782EBBE
MATAAWVVAVGLLVAGVVLTSARLVQPAGRFGILLVALTPLGLVAYGLATLVLGAMLLAAPVLGLWALAVVAVGGLVVHARWLAPLVAGAGPAPAADARRLVVMTANLAQRDGDPAALVRLAGAERVDLLVVEEILPEALAAMDDVGLAGLLPHRLGEPLAGAAGTMVFARSPLTLVAPLATTQEGWVARVDGLVVVAAHPQAPTLPADWHADQAALLAAVHEHAPDLVLGDLNATTDHASLRRLARSGHRDVVELTNGGWQPTWPAGRRWAVLGSALPVARIDHVLAGPRMAALSTRTVALPGSDHRAVVATVAVR